MVEEYYYKPLRNIGSQLLKNKLVNLIARIMQHMLIHTIKGPKTVILYAIINFLYLRYLLALLINMEIYLFGSITSYYQYASLLLIIMTQHGLIGLVNINIKGK